MLFKDWRLGNCDPIKMDLNPKKLYYIHAQACYLKGYLGGTHSYLTLYHQDKWVVVELTDRETLSVQKAKIIYKGTNSDDITEHAPFISDRLPNGRWFGHDPRIVGSCMAPKFSDIVECCKSYPIKEFRILYRNCNTFTSYVIYKMNLEIQRPLRSVGFRSNKWWSKNYDHV